MDENKSGKTTSRDPSAIERDIAETRDSIDSTMEELGQRLAPSQLVDDAKSFVKEKAMRGATTIWTRMSENAVPLGLIGGSVIWIMRSERGNGHWSEQSPAWNGNRERGDRSSAFTARRDDGEGIHPMDQAREVVDHVRERAAEVGSQAKQTTSRAMGNARDRFDTLRVEQPLLLGIASLALGALLGGLIPTTRREDELFGETRDQVIGAAADAGREKAEQAREAIVKEQASDENQSDRREGASAPPTPR